MTPEVGDLVHVTAGRHAGRAGRVVAVIDLRAGPWVSVRALTGGPEFCVPAVAIRIVEKAATEERT